MRRLLRTEFVADWVAAAYVIAYYAWLALRTPGTPATILIGEITFYPLGLVVGLAYVRNARLRALDRRTRTAWGILGAGALTLWIVGNTWPRLITAFGPAAFPGWVGVMEIVQHVLLIAAILAFPGRVLARGDRLRFTADLAIFLAAGLVLVHQFGARASAAVSPASPPVVAFAQSVMDWAVIVAAAAGVLHKRDATTRVVLSLLMAATLLYFGANYTLSTMPAYRMGDGVDGLWFAAWICRWMAARFAWHRYRRAGPGLEMPAAQPAVDIGSGAFSYAVASLTFALLLVRLVSGGNDSLLLHAASAAAMALLLISRQLIELRENRRLYAARLAQETRFRAFVQHASDVVLVVDEQGCISYASPSSDRAFGAGSAGPGTPVRALLPAETLSDALPMPGEEPRAVRHASIRVRTAGGGWREFDIVATDLRADPAVRGTVLNARDVTERRELERQLHQAQQLEAVGLMAGGLAHDFNNVLTAIKGYTDLLRNDLPAGSSALADLPRIDEAVDRAVAVTRKLLAFSRRRESQRVILDVNAVLQDLAPLVRQVLTDRVDVQTSFAAGVWPVRADAGQIEQVVINLVTNARDAMPDGGVLAVSTANVSVPPARATASTPAGDYVAITVSDSGTGIPEAIRGRVFEPFFGTKPRDRGLGLGLAVVRTIVAQHDGVVAIDSEEGLGTTVTVLLPRSGTTRASMRDAATGALP